MQLNQFLLLPVLISTLTLSSPYTLPASYTPADSVQSEQTTSEVQEPVEANPVVEEEVREKVVEEEVPTVKTPVPREVNSTPPGSIESNGAVLRSELIEICRCESGLRQFKDDGTVLRGIVNPLDIGLCQINLKYHEAAANNLGYDLFTLEGNIRYANYLYAAQGAQPWGWSASCHGKY